MADDLAERLRALAHERLQAEMHDHIPARGKRHQKMRIAFAEAADRITALQAQHRKLVEALRTIARFDDKLANDHLIKTGSYSGFDEPGSVEIARAAIAEAEKGADHG